MVVPKGEVFVSENVEGEGLENLADALASMGTKAPPEAKAPEAKAPEPKASEAPMTALIPVAPPAPPPPPKTATELIPELVQREGLQGILAALGKIPDMTVQARLYLLAMTPIRGVALPPEVGTQVPAVFYNPQMSSKPCRATITRSSIPTASREGGEPITVWGLRGDIRGQVETLMLTKDQLAGFLYDPNAYMVLQAYIELTQVFGVTMSAPRPVTAAKGKPKGAVDSSAVKARMTKLLKEFGAAKFGAMFDVDTSNGNPYEIVERAIAGWGQERLLAMFGTGEGGKPEAPSSDSSPNPFEPPVPRKKKVDKAVLGNVMDVSEEDQEALGGGSKPAWEGSGISATATLPAGWEWLSMGRVARNMDGWMLLLAPKPIEIQNVTKQNEKLHGWCVYRMGMDSGNGGVLANNCKTAEEAIKKSLTVRLDDTSAASEPGEPDEPEATEPEPEDDDSPERW